MLQESPTLEGNIQNVSRPQVLLVLYGIYKHTHTPIRTYMLTSTIDKMHFRGHTDKWYQEHCNPYKFDKLKEVGIS